MVMAGFSSSYSFVRRSSGLSPSWSYSGQGTHRGVAADFGFGRFVLSTFLSFPGLRDRWEQRKDADLSLLPGGNLAWYGRNGQISFTGFGRRSVSGRRLLTGKVSLDARYNFKGIDFFGEGAWDFAGDTGAGVAGISFPAWNEFRAFGVLRLYPSAFTAEYAGGVRSRSKTSDEYGVALGLERGPAVLTADFSGKPSDPERIQGKFLLKWPLQLFPTAVLTFRATERIRPSEWLRYRTDLRMDLVQQGTGCPLRDEPLKGGPPAGAQSPGVRSVGLLSYLEGLQARCLERLSPVHGLPDRPLGRPDLFLTERQEIMVPLVRKNMLFGGGGLEDPLTGIGDAPALLRASTISTPAEKTSSRTGYISDDRDW